MTPVYHEGSVSAIGMALPAFKFALRNDKLELGYASE